MNDDEMIFVRVPAKAFAKIDFVAKLKGRKHEELILQYIANGLRVSASDFSQAKVIESGITYDFTDWLRNYRFKDDVQRS